MNKPPTCEVCNASIAIYHCPRCSTSTCSLKCCRAHKISSTEDGSTNVVCNGKRDRTKFCSLKGFDDAQLASDYHFLEDVLKLSEGSKRLYDGLVTGSSCETNVKAGAKRTRGTFRSTKDELASITEEVPVHPLLKAREGKSIGEVLVNEVDDAGTSEKDHDSLKALTICSPPDQKTNNSTRQNNRKPHAPKIDPLVRQAELKGINLLRMPSGMQRHLSNTSKFNKRHDTITWKTELNFHLPLNGVGADEDEDDDQLLSDDKTQPTIFTLQSEMDDTSTLVQELGKHLDVLPGNSSTRSTLRTFATAPRNSLLLFMKRLPCSSAAPKYYQIDPDVTLAESLRGKTLIEFPTFEIVAEEDRERFPLFIGEMS